ncbi:hypothetical protein AgCh_024780 [Apium graveolens]
MTAISRVLLLENDILHDGDIGGRDRFSNSSLFCCNLGLIDLELFTYEEAYDATLRIGSAIRGRGVNPVKTKLAQASSMPITKTFENFTSFNLRPPPIDRHKSFDEDDLAVRPITAKKVNTTSINAMSYSIADLQITTNIFNVEDLIGEGSTGRVYRAQFDDGRALNHNAGSGYSAPEVAMSAQYTIKSDVYGFGVSMLELLSGRKSFESSRPRSEQSLVRWATPQLHDIDALAKMVDPALNGLYPVKSLSRFADVIALCVQRMILQSLLITLAERVVEEEGGYDFSKFSWTYFLKSKDEAIEIIINHIRQVNSHPDFKVRRIRSDNRIEFKNSLMRLFCEENGIMHNFSASRTPKQNGVVERKNRSLIEAARTMLEESKLPTYFWVEPVNTACYTQNISLVNQAKCMTPYQLFMNRNQTEQHGKFDAKADEGIFIGYAVGKAYRIYNLRTNIAMESVHVVFDDKKIEGLKDEGFHDSLKFDNVVIICDDSDDDSDQEIVAKDNAEKFISNDAQNSASVEVQNASFVGRQSASSVGIQSASFVETIREAESQNRSLTERTPSSNQRSTNLGGVSSNQNSFTHQDSNEASSFRANLPQ